MLELGTQFPARLPKGEVVERDSYGERGSWTVYFSKKKTTHMSLQPILKRKVYPRHGPIPISSKNVLDRFPYLYQTNGLKGTVDPID